MADTIGSDSQATAVGEVLALAPGVAATVSSAEERTLVVVSIDQGVGTSLTIRIPAQQASDLAVALVNAANGL